MLIVEHKSCGKSLGRAFDQALDHFPGIRERDLPRHVIVSDFARLRLTDLVSGDEAEFALADLHKHLRRFAFIAGYQVQSIKPQDRVNLRAAERMGWLHDALKASGYDDRPLEVLRAAYAGGQRILDVHRLIALDVDRFHGIEIEEFPAQIAQVALWLIDHQMNLRVSEEFGQYFARIPLKATPRIVHGNALRLDWAEVLPARRAVRSSRPTDQQHHAGRAGRRAVGLDARPGRDDPVRAPDVPVEQRRARHGRGDHRRGVVTHLCLDARPRGHPQPPRFGGTEVARAQRE
jgi:hypothetical protein